MSAPSPAGDGAPADVATDRPRPAHVARWLGLDTGVRAAISFVVGIAVARSLGPDGYGTLALAVTVVTILGPIGGLGTDSLLVQRLAADGPRSAPSASLLRSAAQVRAAGAALVTVAAIALALPRDPTEAAAILAVTPALLASPFEAGWSWLIAGGRVRGAVLVRLACSVAFAAARLAAVGAGAGVVWFAALTGADLLVQAAVAGAAAWRQGARFGPAAGFPRGLLRDSLPLLAGGVFYLVMLRVDVLLIDALLGPTETGEYAAVTRFAEAPTLVAVVVVGALAPHIVATHAVGSPGYRREHRRLVQGLGLVGTAVALVLCLAAPLVVSVLLGAAFEPAVPALAVLAWSIVPVFLATARERVVVDLGLTRTTFVNLVAGGVTNVALNLVLLPAIGITGAAVATVAAYLVALVVAPALDRRQRPVNRVLASAVRRRATAVAPAPDATAER